MQKIFNAKNAKIKKLPKNKSAQRGCITGLLALLFRQNMKTTYKESDQWGFTN
mgnify:CR=1 FL=1